MNNIYFLHGLDSSGSGTKGRFFNQQFPQIQRPDFTGDLQQRLRQLETLCCEQRELCFIGSSFGGLMATCFAIKHPKQLARLILLAPALNYEAYSPPEKKITIPTLVVIGDKDTVTPAATVLPLAKKSFTKLEVQVVDDDHMLHSSFTALDWHQLLI